MSISGKQQVSGGSTRSPAGGLGNRRPRARTHGHDGQMLRAIKAEIGADNNQRRAGGLVLGRPWERGAGSARGGGVNGAGVHSHPSRNFPVAWPWRLTHGCLRTRRRRRYHPSATVLYLQRHHHRHSDACAPRAYHCGLSAVRERLRATTACDAA